MTRQEALALLEEMKKQPIATPDLESARLAERYVALRGNPAFEYGEAEFHLEEDWRKDPIGPT